MTAPKSIIDLVARFSANRESYCAPTYKEAHVRQEFINPFFEALGWDMANRQDFAEAYKEVIHEDALKVGAATKAPDYSFRVGGTRKFFVEAKTPSVNIKDNIDPAYQLRRYAWSAKLPLSILTDFEEFSVYSCREKPDKNDKASVGRILYIKCDEYEKRWDEIATVFSKDAVQKGLYDKYAESAKGKKGTSTVDDEFLGDIERWRDMLARDIALRNEKLSTRELNFAVQRTIDRIIFLRICEDRGIEHYGTLMALLNGENVYKRIRQNFQRADEIYNSGLFHFRDEKGRAEPPDTLTLSLNIDDKPLKDIIENLYYPESPYEFSVMPADILGQVYEQFLGKVIRLTAGHQAKVEDKPEVKKAGGVFYTPTYIVDYIVKNTVGKLVEGKTPKQIEKLKILDPACGSGSFLIHAYQFLLDYHLDWYIKDGIEKHSKGKEPELVQVRSGEWRLSTPERKKILLNNIHGVDIDSQAVEVTKLSLLLKVLEGENEQSLAQQMTLWHERALPDLENNIKCGNSLIGSDFYEGVQETMVLYEDDENEERIKINAFDWDGKHGFPEIMKSGGFDVVIGNPPYLRIQGLQEHYANQIDFFISKYTSAVKRFDLYLLFIEKGFFLLKTGGLLSYICPHKFINSDFGSGLREFLINNSAIEIFISFGNNPIFLQASTYTGIIILSKTKKNKFGYYEFPVMDSSDLCYKLFKLKQPDYAHIPFSSLSASPWMLTSSKSKYILDKIRQPQSLGDFFEELFQGVVTGMDDLYFLEKTNNSKSKIVEVYSPREKRRIKIERDILKPMLKGEDVSRYKQPVCKYYCIYPYMQTADKTKILEEKEFKEKYPLAYSYLSDYKADLISLRKKFKTNPKYWYSCHRGRSIALFNRDRIITPEISLGCNMTIDVTKQYHNTKVYSLIPPTKSNEKMGYWLGILNSKLMWYFLSTTGYVLRGGYFVFKTNYLKPFPIRTINFSSLSDKSLHDKVVSLVTSMLDLHKKLPLARTDHEKTLLYRQIDATDQKIDELVYELYGLTEEEIKIVEGKI